MEKKIGFARKRAMDEAGEVEMKDVADFDGKVGKSDKAIKEGKGDADMDIDGVE